VVAEYTLDERRTHLVSTLATHAELADPDSALAAALGGYVTARGSGDDAVVDLYLHWPDAPEDADETSRALQPLVAALPFSQEVRRFSVAVCAGATRPVGYFTFRPDGHGGAVEDTLTRGVHPMVGRRLNPGGSGSSTSPASRHPRTCCSTTAWPARTPPTGD
jgi:hypothetical protein